MHTTADIPPDAASPKYRGLFVWVFLTLVALGNLFVLAVAWQDRSWGALYIAIFGGPILNGVLLIVGLVAILFLKRHRVSFPVARYLALTTGFPIAAAVADFFIITSMGLHGC